MRQVTYQGTTKEEIQRMIIYIEDVLQNDMEAWEAKEFNQVLQEYKMQINRINEIENIINHEQAN